jgi:hypothetical protein
MPSYTMLNVKMQRESNAVPWGFRMQGKFVEQKWKHFQLRIFRWKRFWFSITNSKGESK